MKDINEFITITQRANGKTKLKFTDSNKVNIYKLLREFGYRKTKLNNQKIYFRRKAEEIFPTSFDEIRNTFRDFLKNRQLLNVPEGIRYTEILNYYYQQRPIKENKLFHSCLQDTFTENEAHDFLMQTDSSYRHRHEIQQLLAKFVEWKFIRIIDTVGAFCKGRPLYYKNISDKKFLVFSHYNVGRKQGKDGFDCWIATYGNDKHMGAQKPLELQTIKFSFVLNNDWGVIKDYIN